MEAKHPNGASLNRVRLSYRRSASNDFDISATCFCADPSRTGFGTDDLAIFSDVGFATIDDAIAALTDGVVKAAHVFVDTDYLLLGESYLDVMRFDKSKKVWVKIKDVVWRCAKCQHEVRHAGLWAVDSEGLIPLCIKCDAPMHKH